MLSRCSAFYNTTMRALTEAATLCKRADVRAFVDPSRTPQVRVRPEKRAPPTSYGRRCAYEQRCRYSRRGDNRAHSATVRTMHRLTMPMVAGTSTPEESISDPRRLALNRHGPALPMGRLRITGVELNPHLTAAEAIPLMAADFYSITATRVPYTFSIHETLRRVAQRHPWRVWAHAHDKSPIHCLRRTTESRNGLVPSVTNRNRLKAATPPNRRIAPWTVRSSLVSIAR